MYIALGVLCETADEMHNGSRSKGEYLREFVSTLGSKLPVLSERGVA